MDGFNVHLRGNVKLLKQPVSDDAAIDVHPKRFFEGTCEQHRRAGMWLHVLHEYSFPVAKCEGCNIRFRYGRNFCILCLHHDFAPNCL